MSRINLKLQTISPVHVGSGDILYPREDYRYNPSNKNIQILEPATNNVIREMNIFSPIPNIQEAKKEIKELMRNGMGLPYIPGSSIKGAIRTAILSELVMNADDKEYNNIQKIITNGKSKQELVAGDVEKHFFGETPNEDLFRFLIVSDAMFPKGSDCVQRTFTPINLDSLGEIKQRNPGYEMYVEALQAGATADTFSIKFNKKSHRLTYSNKECSEMPFGLNSIEELFKVINHHTYTLIDCELNTFRRLISNPQVEAYCKQLEYILGQKPTDNNSCVLRVGFGSGWKGITGDWIPYFDHWDQLLPDNYDAGKVKKFPRTRRTAYNSFLLGFIMISK